MDTTYDTFEYVPNKIYEITINPDDKHQYVSSKDSRINKVRSDLKECLEETGLKYALRLEISRPRYGDKFKGTIARLHYHGYIMFPTYEDIFNFFCNHWHKITSWSNVIISFNDSPERIKEWTKYILKDKKYIPKHAFQLENFQLKHLITPLES